MIRVFGRARRMGRIRLLSSRSGDDSNSPNAKYPFDKTLFHRKVGDSKAGKRETVKKHFGGLIDPKRNAIRSIKNSPKMKPIYDRISKCTSAEEALEYVATIKDAASLLSPGCLRVLLRKIRTPRNELLQKKHSFDAILKSILTAVEQIAFRELPFASVLCILESLFQIHRLYGLDVSSSVSGIYRIVAGKIASSSVDEFKQIVALLDSRTVESLKEFNIPAILLKSLAQRLNSPEGPIKIYLDSVVNIVGLADQIGCQPSAFSDLWKPIQKWALESETSLTHSDVIRLLLIMSFVPSCSESEAVRVIQSGIKRIQMNQLNANDTSMVFLAIMNISSSWEQDETVFPIHEYQHVFTALEKALPSLSTERYCQCLDALTTNEIFLPHLTEAFINEAHFKCDTGMLNLKQMITIVNAMNEFDVQDYSLLQRMSKNLDEFLHSPRLLTTSSDDIFISIMGLYSFSDSPMNVLHPALELLVESFISRYNEFSFRQKIDIFFATCTEFPLIEKNRHKFLKNEVSKLSTRQANSLSCEHSLKLLFCLLPYPERNVTTLERVSQSFLSKSSEATDFLLLKRFVSSYSLLPNLEGQWASGDLVLRNVLEQLRLDPNVTSMNMFETVDMIGSLDRMNIS